MAANGLRNEMKKLADKKKAFYQLITLRTEGPKRTLFPFGTSAVKHQAEPPLTIKKDNEKVSSFLNKKYDEPSKYLTYGQIQNLRKIIDPNAQEDVYGVQNMSRNNNNSSRLVLP